MRTHCKRSRPLPYYNPNCRTPRYWKFTQHHHTTRPPLFGEEAGAFIRAEAFIRINTVLNIRSFFYAFFSHLLQKVPYFFGYKTQFFFLPNNPKNLDPSYKMDLDLRDCLGRVKFVLHLNFVGLIKLFIVAICSQLFVVAICSHSRERKTPSYSRKKHNTFVFCNVTTSSNW